MSEGDVRQALIDECHRQSENCSYTATSFTIWLRWLRRARVLFVAGPVVFGALATWQIVAQGSPTLGAVFALLATVMPPVYRASKADEGIEQYTKLAGEFTNLRDRFRQAALVTSKMSFDEFKVEARALFDRLDKARSRPLTPPPWSFTLGRWKIKAGHYEHDYDQKPGSQDGTGKEPGQS
jgi:hypothetical protein